jgi:hypothetical protein
VGHSRVVEGAIALVENVVLADDLQLAPATSFAPCRMGDLGTAPLTLLLISLAPAEEPTRFDVPAVKVGIGYIDKRVWSGGEQSLRWWIGADEGPVREVGIEVSILALNRERSPEGGCLKAPEGIRVANPARIEGEIGHMQVGTPRLILNEGLIIAHVAGSDARAEMQDVAIITDHVIDRATVPRAAKMVPSSPIKPGKSGALATDPEASALLSPKMPAANPKWSVQYAVMKPICRCIDKGCTLHGVDEQVAGHLFE